MQVNDSEGNPVQAEFSLALIDKAILSLAQEQTSTLLETFYRERGLGVQEVLPPARGDELRHDNRDPVARLAQRIDLIDIFKQRFQEYPVRRIQND